MVIEYAQEISRISMHKVLVGQYRSDATGQSTHSEDVSDDGV